MKRNRVAVSALVATAVLMLFVIPAGASNPSWWTGHNEALSQYYVAPGYPPYPQHARYIGELTGTWYEMGVQYGERAGDLIRLVFEGYYEQILSSVGDATRIVPDARRFGEYLSKLVPEAVEFMKGIADGASAELAKSHYASVGNALDKILIINHYFALRYVTGTQYTGLIDPADLPTVASLPVKDLPACTGVVVLGTLGGPTKDRTTIHGGTKDQVFFPQMYAVTYTTRPSDPNAARIWTVVSAGEIGGQMAGNEHGVIISGYAGGNAKGIWAYGLEWNVGVWYAATFAKSAEEAVQLLTVGRPGRIEATGKRIVLSAWGINWLISDKRNAAVVEMVPGRYAVRRPGDFGEEDFIVSTNHNVATWSYNENNERTDVPMTEFGDETGPYSGLSVSGTRYWTMFWNVKHNYGQIDREMVMDWYRGHYYIDKNGERHDYVWVEEIGWVPSHLLATTPCRHRPSPPDVMKGATTDAKVGVAQDLAFYFTHGRPCEWKGPWDLISLKYVPPVE